MLRSARNYDKAAFAAASAIKKFEPTRTQQSQAKEADINTIVKRFAVTGMLPQRSDTPLDIDFDDVFDFQSAQNAVRRAQEMFQALPAEVRKRFNDNPGEFLDFAEDEGNHAELVKMGLAKPKEDAIIDPKPADPPPA